MGIIPEGEDRGPTAFLVTLAISFLTASWCFFDGRVRGKRPARVGLMALVFAAPFAYPVYCVWSRGLRGLVFSIATTLAFLATVALSAGVTMALVALAADR